MTAFGEGLVEAAQQALAIAKGEAQRGTYGVHAPQEFDVKAVRLGLGFTRAEFAARFGFPVDTLRDLDQGHTRPDTAMRAYLTVIRHDATAVIRALEHAQEGD